MGSRRYALLDDQWYEVDAAYLSSLRNEITELLATPPPLDLPGWDLSWREERYNLHVQDVRPNFVCLDQHGVRTQLHNGSGVEMCDLLGPGNELIHVKRARGSAPLSHLFAQGLLATKTLLNSAEARSGFAALVQQRAKGRDVPEDFTPKKVIFAILLKKGEPLTPDTLFPFSQVMLARTAKQLRRDEIAVEVIGVPAQP